MKKLKQILLILILFFISLPQFNAKSSIAFDSSWQYGNFSEIHTGKSTLYTAGTNGNGVVVAINAGHGTQNGESKQTYCHPDKTPKVTGGTTAAGATTSPSISSGMTFKDGTAEADITLKLAVLLKNQLLANGFDVLMLRENNDAQLDNVARTVMANNNAAFHISLHYDSTETDKGAFYMSVPNVASYREMTPVKEMWKDHHKLGDALIGGLKAKEVKIFGEGKMEMDLTQTSFSTIPSIDIELGDKASDYSSATLNKLVEGLVQGISDYSGEPLDAPSTIPDDGNPDDGTAPDIDTDIDDMDPLKPGTGDCTTVFKNPDGSFNEFGQFMQDIFTLMKFAAPILVIALSTIDYMKAISAQNADDMKKSNGKFVKRLIAGIVLFLLPFLLDLMFEIFGLYGLGTCGIR